ncbi:MAG: hypothetical protein ACERKZ_10370 [Lachnotalea sp.]
MSRTIKYVSLFFLLAQMLILPLDWYTNMVINPDNFEIENVNGLFVFTKDGGRIFMIYLLCLLLQISVIKSKQMLLAIFSNVLFILILITFPVTSEMIKYLNLTDLFKYYGFGFYLSMLMLLLGLCFNVYQLINKRN